MNYLIALCFMVFALAGALSAAADNSTARDRHMVVRESAHPVAVTVARLEAALAAQGIKVMGKVDHAANAGAAGLTLEPTVLVIFGNPKAGTRLMQADRTIGLDLPMKVLVWQDQAGRTRLTYTSPEALKERYGVDGQDRIFKKMSAALDGLTAAAAGSK